MAVEILSPCKNTDALISALRSGCDAVYVGGKMFSARQSADNFTHEELCEAVKLCHKYGVKIYQAINTVATDDELPLLAEEIKNACEIGIDGIISQDLAVVNMVKKAESVGDYGFPLSASPSGALQTEKRPRGETLEFHGNMRRRRCC